jgi:CheY-like chemotaxis protein
VQKKILIVESELAIAGVLDGRLKSRGYVPTIVNRSEDALGQFDQRRPDMVIVSLTLPGDAGVSLCRQLRQRPLGALVPILLLGTGHETVATAQQAIEVGADHYFQKPDQIAELLTKVMTYVGPGSEPSPMDSAFRGDESDHQQGEDGINEWADLDGLLRPSNRDGEDTVGEGDLDSTSSLVESMLSDGDQLDVGESETGDENSGEAAVTASLRSTASTLPEFQTGRDEFVRPKPPLIQMPRQVIDTLQSGRPVSLSERGIERILRDVEAEAMTGRLEIASGGVLRRIFFENGRPVFADSSASVEDLAAFLVAEGLVVSDVLQQARARGEAVGVTAEEVLIEAGLLSAEDVYGTLKAHVLDRVFAFFGLEDGDGVIIKGGPRPLDPIELSLPVPRIILDGIRRKFGRLRLYGVYGTASVVPQRALGNQLPKQLVLRAEEKAVLNQCDGRCTALEIARITGMGDVDTIGILYGLSILGLIENDNQETRVLAQIGPAAERRALAPRTADQLPGYAELVQTMYAGVQTTDYFQILGVDRGATQSEIRAAFDDASRRFDPHRVGRDSPLWVQVKEIASVVDDAYRLLSNDRLRNRYEMAIR